MSLKIITFLILLLLPIVNIEAQCTDDTHSTNQSDSWVSCQASANPNTVRGNSHWIMYDLGYVYTLGTTTIWNYNIENETGKGFKNVAIDYLNGTTWVAAGQFQLPEASGNSTDLGFSGFDFGGVEARYVLLTALDNWNGGNCAGISEFKIDLETPVLPLDFLNFSAKSTDNSILLNWESRNENNFSHFEIERSTDAAHFNFIKKIASHNSANISSYQFDDTDVKSGQLYYYRLKMMDLDGTYQFSPIRKAQIKNELGFSIFPNPTSNILNISIEKNIAKEIIIQNAVGHEILRRNVSQEVQQIDTNSFAVGIYFCHVVGRYSILATRRFVKVD